MASSALAILREQGQGITGALLVVGLATLYTMETWWLGWTLPLVHLLLYGLGGLLVVFLVTRKVGFRHGPQGQSLRQTVVDFSELVVQSFAAATLTLFVFGVLDLDSSPLTIVRLAMVQAVPLGFGASLARLLLQPREDDRTSEAVFPDNLATFALGAVFITMPLAPTEEMDVITVQAGAVRLAALIVLSVLVVHLVLHEVGYRQQSERIADKPLHQQIGLAFVAYVVAVAVAACLLLGFGQLSGASAFETVQIVVVLGFPASVGASGAEVVL